MLLLYQFSHRPTANLTKPTALSGVLSFKADGGNSASHRTDGKTEKREN